MLESGWLFVGGVAVLFVQDDGLAIIGGTAGTITWGVWTYGTLNVRVVGDAVTYTFTMPALRIALALVPAYIALTGPVELVQRANGGTSTEDL